MTASQAKRWFYWTAGVTLVIKLWLAVYFPITSDEAFFHEWANFPNWGYYDHPPMVGWWLWALTRLGHEAWIIRSATVLLTTLLAYGVVNVTQMLLNNRHDPRAWLAGAVYLSMPVSWYFVFVTTDTPLVFFMGLSIWVYVRAMRNESVAGVFVAGLFLGLAFLSKYFAVLLGFAMGWHILWQRKRWAYAAALMAGVLPLAAINVGYNATNCWNNIMFNLVNRHDDAQLGWKTVATYLGMMVYLISPWVLWALLRNARVWASLGQAPVRALCAVAGVPLLLFLVISLEKTVGLHWVLGFIPPLFVLMALSVNNPRTYTRMVWANVAWSVPHMLLFAALMHGPTSLFKSDSFKQDVLFHRHGAEVVQTLSQGMPEGGVLTTIAYSPAALMSYHLGKVVPVFGPGKYHARNDDVFVDWREMNGKAIRVVSKAKPLATEQYAPYLSEVRESQVVTAGVTFYMLDGVNFNYPLFREQVLKSAAEKYYRIPGFLPVLDCPFARKYGFEEICGLQKSK